MDKSYNLSMILRLLSLLKEHSDDLKRVIEEKHGSFFDDSGKKAFSFIGLLFKYGVSIAEISNLLLYSSQLAEKNFMASFVHGIHFLAEIEMERNDVVKIIRDHPLVLGSFASENVSSLLVNLNIEMKRAICCFIMEDPVVRLKERVLANTVETLKADHAKEIFLLKLGFRENSDELQEAIKRFRGRGDELQERFDCLVNAWLDNPVVVDMIKSSPLVLRQSSDLIKQKIDLLVNTLGYSLHSIVQFPAVLGFKMERVILRLSMYSWMQKELPLEQELSLATILAASEKVFVSKYVECHPKGPQVWEILKKSSSEATTLIVPQME